MTQLYCRRVATSNSWINWWSRRVKLTMSEHSSPNYSTRLWRVSCTTLVKKLLPSKTLQQTHCPLCRVKSCRTRQTHNFITVSMKSLWEKSLFSMQLHANSCTTISATDLTHLFRPLKRVQLQHKTWSVPNMATWARPRSSRKKWRRARKKPWPKSKLRILSSVSRT